MGHICKPAIYYSSHGSWFCFVMIGLLSSKCVWLDVPWCGTNTPDKLNICFKCQPHSSSSSVAARRKHASDFPLLGIRHTLPRLLVPLEPNVTKMCNICSVKPPFDWGDGQVMSCYILLSKEMFKGFKSWRFSGLLFPCGNELVMGNPILNFRRETVLTKTL